VQIGWIGRWNRQWRRQRSVAQPEAWQHRRRAHRGTEEKEVRCLRVALGTLLRDAVRPEEHGQKEGRQRNHASSRKGPRRWVDTRKPLFWSTGLRAEPTSEGVTFPRERRNLLFCNLVPFFLRSISVLELRTPVAPLKFRLIGSILVILIGFWR